MSVILPRAYQIVKSPNLTTPVKITQLSVSPTYKPKVYKTEALVIKHHVLNDANKALTLYSPQMGKLRVVAKGVLKPRSKLAGHIEPFTRISIMASRGKNLDVLSQVFPLESFIDLRDDLFKACEALYVIELLDLFTKEEDPSSNLYNIALETLRGLINADDGSLVLRQFELRLLADLGFAPELDVCLSCSEHPRDGDGHFSANAGGLLCTNCAHRYQEAVPLSTDALITFRYLRNCCPDTILEKVAPRHLSKEMKLALRKHIVHQLEREVRSIAFLDQLDSIETDLPKSKA